ncbi:MAG: fused response regulator/phosphatase [Pseudomonadota bacterium]
MLQRSFADLKTDPTLTQTSVPVRQRVLVLDDSRAQRSLMSSFLRKWGHDVIASADPFEALEIAKSRDIDLILSDWMMPGMTGPEFCRQLRAARQESYVYVILLTSKTDNAALAEALEAGADDFLNKPFAPPELRARLNAGARIVAMQRESVEKNHLLTAALDEIQNLYSALDQDLDEARRLQQSLLQDRFRNFRNVDISLWLQASGHVGGDMVGFFPVSDSVIGAFSLDVSGHGVASAMIAARVAGILSDASPDQNISLMRRDDGSLAALPPDMAASRLNSMILKEMRTDRYFTLCLCFLNRKTGIVRLVQAGHPHPMIQRADGSVELVGEGGLPIGLLAEAEFKTTEVRLWPGDRMLLYSDGLTECPAPSGEALDEEGLEHLMQVNRRKSGQVFMAALAEGVIDFAGTDSLPDDASALMIDYRSPEDDTAADI